MSAFPLATICSPCSGLTEDTARVIRYCLVALAICSIQLLLWLRSEGYMHDATQTVHRQSLAAPMELPRSPVAIQFAGDDQLRSDDAMLEKGPDHGAEFANEVMVETTTDTKVEEDV